MKAGSFLSLTFIFMIIMAPIAFASSITNYTYDPNGNMLSDGEFNYTYNAANQMVMAIEADTGDFVEEYLYDHSGNRVKKIESATGGNKTTYYISGLYEITVNPDGSMTNTTYVYANGERVARNETNENGSTAFYYHSDHLQSTSVVTTNGNLMSNLTEADSDWTTIQLNKSLSRPVVIAKITSESETDNSEIRITNASSNSFIIKIEETTAFDGNHGNETVSYIALEEGTIANGADTIGEAGTIEAGPIWTRVTFEEAFNEIPIVIASPMTQNDATAGVARVRNIYKTGFDVRFEEYGGGDHPLETIGWIALKTGTHTLDGSTITARSTSANENYSSVLFSGFSETPAILTQIQSYTESDYGAHTRVTNATFSGFEIKIEENNDTAHAAETIGYIAIEPTVIKSGSAKVEETKYYPYGVIQEGGNEKYLYTGKEMDAGTGLYYYEARYYSPSVGRFVQVDLIIPSPYNPQSLNRYSYVQNNPLRYTDPSGHEVEDIIKSVGRDFNAALFEEYYGIPAGKYFMLTDVYVISSETYPLILEDVSEGNILALTTDTGILYVRIVGTISVDVFVDIPAFANPVAFAATSAGYAYLDEIVFERQVSLHNTLIQETVSSTTTTSVTTTSPGSSTPWWPSFSKTTEKPWWEISEPDESVSEMDGVGGVCYGTPINYGNPPGGSSTLGSLQDGGRPSGRVGGTSSWNSPDAPDWVKNYNK